VSDAKDGLAAGVVSFGQPGLDREAQHVWLLRTVHWLPWRAWLSVEGRRSALDSFLGAFPAESSRGPTGGDAVFSATMVTFAEPEPKLDTFLNRFT